MLLEKTLVEKCQNNDMNAFDELVLKYQTRVINLAYSILNNQDDAADAAQEVFVKVYRSIKNFQGNSVLSTWIYRICVNVCNDFLRKKSHRNNLSLNAIIGDEEKEFDIKDEKPSPDEVVSSNETQRIVREAIDSLSKEHREIIILRDINQLSYEEISKTLDCSLGSVKSRLNRARNALKNKIIKNKELFFP